ATLRDEPVPQLLLARADARDVALGERVEESVAITEVEMHGGGVLGARGELDLTNRHVIDAAIAEQLLRDVEQMLPRGFAALRCHVVSVSQALRPTQETFRPTV